MFPSTLLKTMAFLFCSISCNFIRYENSESRYQTPSEFLSELSESFTFSFTTMHICSFSSDCMAYVSVYSFLNKIFI
jgi:hypothetical protein